MRLNQLTKDAWKELKGYAKSIDGPKDLLTLLSIPPIVVSIYFYIYFIEVAKKRQWFKKGDLVKNSLNGNVYIILDELQMDKKHLTWIYKAYDVENMIEEDLFCEEVHLKKYK